MNWLNSDKMKMVLVGVVVVLVLGGGNTKADFTFGEPTALDATINSGGNPWFSCMSNDGLELYIEKPIGGDTMGNWNVYVSTRATTNDLWSAPVKMGPPINTSGTEGCACLSSDDLELYFMSDRPGGCGTWDIWVSTRPTRFDPWEPPENLGPTINTSGYEDSVWITADGLELYFSSYDRPGGYGADDIWVTKRPTVDDNWDTPVNLGSVVNSAEFDDAFPCLSPGGLVLFFSDFPGGGPYRSGGLGQPDMWMSRRKSIMDPWEPPVNLGPELNSSTFDVQPRLSPDGDVLYFSSMRPGGPSDGFNIYQTPIIPIVDLNSDGIVDSADMCIMVDHWGENYPLCDIGPTPLGDGIVDVHDLIVLAKHLFEEMPPAGPSGNIIWVSDQHDYSHNQDGMPDDQEWVDILEAEGYTVDYTMGAAPGQGYWRKLDDDKIAALNAADLIIISQDFEPIERTEWNSVTTPIINTSAYLTLRGGWKWLNTHAGYSGNSLNSKLDILAPDHPIFAGVTSPVQITHGEGVTYFARVTDCGVGNGTMLAKLVTPLARDYAAIVEWEPGVEFYDGAGQIAGGPRMLFTAGTSSIQTVGLGAMNLTPDGLKIFLNAVKLYVEK